MPSQVSAAGCIVVGLSLLAGHAAADPVARRIVALSGTDGPLGPGLGPGIMFGSLDAAFPMIDESGGVAFPGQLTGPGVTGETSQALFHERNGALTVVARSGDPAPQFHPSGAIRTINSIKWALSHDGFLSYQARLKVVGGSSTLDRTSVWAEAQDGLFLVALQGVAAPGGPDGYAFSTSFDRMASTTGGEIAFPATLSQSGQPTKGGIWRFRDGALLPVAVADMPAHEPGMTYRGFQSIGTFEHPSLNPSGTASFRAAVNRVDLPPSTFLYVAQADGPMPVAEEGTQAPGMPDDTFFSTIWSPPMLTSNGRIVFDAWLSGPGAVQGPNGPQEGIWTTCTGTLAPAVLKYTPMPGVEPPMDFTSLGDFSLNDDDLLAFGASNIEHDVGGFWLSPPDGEFRLIVRRGAAAPGSPHGVILDYPMEGPFLNNVGHVAYSAELVHSNGRGEPNWGFNDSGIYVANAVGESVMLFRVGQPIEVSHGDVRWIQNIAFITNGLFPDAGMNQTFNDRSEFACRLYFTDGTYAIAVGRPVSFCSADTNGDGFVNFADINEVLGAFNNAVLEPHYDFDADLDFDGKVDFADLNLVISQLGDDCGR